MKEFNHQVEITTGVLEEECSQMLSGFFTDLRKRLKTEKEGIEDYDS
jgi:tRNA(adenine34) deaminase